MNGSTNKPIQDHLANKFWWQVQTMTSCLQGHIPHLLPLVAKDMLPDNLAKSEIANQHAAREEAGVSPHVASGTKYLK